MNDGVIDGGDLPTVDLHTLMASGSLFVTKYGPLAGIAGPGKNAEFVAEALAPAAKRPIVSPIAARFPLERVADVFRAFEAGVHGKVLVIPGRPD